MWVIGTRQCCENEAKNMCFPATDKLQLGGFFWGGGGGGGGGREKKNSLTKGKKDRLITGWAMDYFFFMDLPFGGI